LRNIDGVLFLAADPAGLTLSRELKETCGSFRHDYNESAN
jgi:hypothetical protein